MATYAVTFTSSARKELERLGQPMSDRVFRRIARLASNRRPAGSRKLKGATDVWRIRAGDYRVLYTINDSLRSVDIGAVRHRSDAYR